LPAGKVSSSASDILNLFNILKPASCLACSLVQETTAYLNLDTWQMPVNHVKCTLIPSHLVLWKLNHICHAGFLQCSHNILVLHVFVLRCNILYGSGSVDEISCSFSLLRMPLAALCLAFFLECPLLRTEI
jgi:hypothetical protein